MHEISSGFNDDDEETTNETLYSNVFGYLLTWKLILKFFSTIKTDERPAYSTYLLNSRLLGDFLSTIFTLISEESGFYCETTSDTQDQMNLHQLAKFLLCKHENYTIAADTTVYFTRGPSLNPKGKFYLFLEFF